MSETITYRYRFHFDQGRRLEFPVVLDRQTLQVQLPARTQLPAWTRLDCHQCPHCPLRPETTPHCPAAVSLIDVFEAFQRVISFETVAVEVVSQGREYRAKVSVQKALSSLVGLHMATSGCPVMAKLRPMAGFHLPFASTAETEYRALSTYLLAQYLVAQHGGTPDWGLQGLVQLYDDVRIVNRSFCERLTTMVVEDANLNAVVNLNVFADSINFSINNNFLTQLEGFFRAYLPPDGSG
ncbi:MAG: hypothetical protein HY696_09445 [Deltaproteobacteria bacterium]|nr:hypothetical protein [Deltaproteobacteria bacterium]